MIIKKFDINPTAWVTFYQRENPRTDKNPMPTIVICPGGGYEHISIRESEPLALAFSAQGFQVFVLSYSVMNKGTQGNFLADTVSELYSVFELIEKNAADWEISPENIFLLGCSAGGHLAAWYSNTTLSHRPKGVLLCYPVTALSFGWPETPKHFNFEIDDFALYNTCEMVNPETPETFLWHTANDDAVPVYNTLKYCERLHKNHVPFESHIFQDGPHGLSLANRGSAPDDKSINPNVARWFPFALDWIDRLLKV